MSLAGKGKYKLPLPLPLTHTHTHSHIQCDKFTSVTHNAVPFAIVKRSVDQTLHRALLQIQASTRVALLCSASPGGQQAGCCHKGNHAVIHVSAPQHASECKVVKAGLALWFVVF